MSSYRAFAFADAASGRTAGDDYASAPYFIPVEVDVQTDATALKALALGISYAEAGIVDADTAAKVNDVTGRIAYFSALLAKSTAQSGRSDLYPLVTQWNDVASAAQAMGDRLVMDGATPTDPKTQAWLRVVSRVEQNGNALAQELKIDRISLMGVVSGFPKGLDAAMGWALQFIKKPVVAARDELLKTLLMIGGAAALILFLLNKSGLKVAVPGASLGSYKRKGRRRGTVSPGRVTRGYGNARVERARAQERLAHPEVDHDWYDRKKTAAPKLRMTQAQRKQMREEEEDMGRKMRRAAARGEY